MPGTTKVRVARKGMNNVFVIQMGMLQIKKSWNGEHDRGSPRGLEKDL
jgi:hypothetical protein